MYFCLDPCERTCTGASRQSCEVWRLSRMQYQLASCCVVVLQHAGGARRNPQGERYLSRFRGRRLYVRYDATKIVSSSSSSSLSVSIRSMLSLSGSVGSRRAGPYPPRLSY